MKGRPNDDSLASVQRRSSNAKLAPQRRVDYKGRNRNEPIPPYVASTYAAIRGTCPASCPFLDAGCYAQANNYVRRLDRRVEELGATGLDIIREEVEKIDRAYATGVPADGYLGRGIDLRLHVSGDVPSTKGARMLADCAWRWKARGGGEVWTYTHRWRRIPWDAWGQITALASVETPQEAAKAFELGYAPAITVEAHEGRQPWTAEGVEFIPCPAQTTPGVTCASCRLCLTDALYARGQGVAFEAHGGRVKRAREQLVNLRRR